MYCIFQPRANTRRRPRIAWPQSHQWLLILLYASLLLLYGFQCVVKYARPSAAGDSLSNQDFLWAVGNAESFKLGFPPQDIRYAGVRLQYHYFTELLAGGLSLVSGIGCYNILAFYLQPCILIALLLCLYRFGQVAFSGSRFKSILFVYFPFIFTDVSLVYSLVFGRSAFWNSYTSHLITNINGYSTATVFLCVFCGLFFHAARQKYRVNPVYYLTIFGAFFLLCFSKGPTGALLVCGLLAAILVGLPLRQTGLRGLVLLGGILAIFLLIFSTIFSAGAQGSVSISAYDTMMAGRLLGPLMVKLGGIGSTGLKLALPLLMLLQVFLMFPVQLPLFLRGLGPDLHAFKAISAERMLAYAMVPGGLIGYFFFFHSGMSQIYLLFAACFFISYFAVDNTDYLRRYFQDGKWVAKGLKKAKKILLGFCALAVAVAFVTTAMLYTYMLGSGLRQGLRNAGVLEKYPYPYVDSADDEAGALWLEEHCPPGVLFATNRVQTNPINSFYSAMSGRQAFVEEYTYTQSNMALGDEAVAERLAVNRILFSPDSSLQTVVETARANGIGYLLYARQSGALEGSETVISQLPCVYASERLSIYKVE